MYSLWLRMSIPGNYPLIPQRGFAEVEWSDSGKRSIHKVGDGGKV